MSGYVLYPIYGGFQGGHRSITETLRKFFGLLLETEKKMDSELHFLVRHEYNFVAFNLIIKYILNVILPLICLNQVQGRVYLFYTEIKELSDKCNSPCRISFIISLLFLQKSIIFLTYSSLGKPFVLPPSR